MLPLIGLKNTQLNKRCTRIATTDTGRQLIYFSDGTTFEADLVIGADGVKSTVRKAILGDRADHKVLRALSLYCYRGLVPIESLKSECFDLEVQTEALVWIGLGKVRPDRFISSFKKIIWISSL